jgi:hypothetical protein
MVACDAVKNLCDAMREVIPKLTVEGGGWRVELGKVEVGGWRLNGKGQRVEGEGGGWVVEGEVWRVEGGGGGGEERAAHKCTKKWHVPLNGRFNKIVSGPKPCLKMRSSRVVNEGEDGGDGGMNFTSRLFPGQRCHLGSCCFRETCK